MEIGKQKEIQKGKEGREIQLGGLSKNDKTDPPHNTQKIIAESLGNKQDLLEIGRQREAQKGKEGREMYLKGLSINDKPLDPPHNTRAIIAESLGMSTGKVAQAELVRTDLLSINDKKLDPLKIGWQSSLAGLSKNDKPGNPPHNTRAIIAESLGNKQDLLEIGRQREAMGGGDKKSAAAKSGLSKNDKPGNPPHNTREIIAGNDQA